VASDSPLHKTFDLLARSANAAATPVLVAALDSPHAPIADGALRAIFNHRHGDGTREVIRRWHLLDEAARGFVADHQTPLAGALRDTLLEHDDRTCANACELVLTYHHWDLLPVLVNVAEDSSHPQAQRAAATLLDLVQRFYDELAAGRDYSDRRDPQLVRRHLVATLELAVERFAAHRCRQVVEAFLLLVGRDNSTLKRILHDPHHGTFLVVVDLLSHSPRPGVMRLVLGFLEDREAPSSALSVLAHRSDAAFVRHLLAKVGAEPSAFARANLRRMDNILWARSGHAVLDALDEAGQQAAVNMVIASGMRRLAAFELVHWLLTGGNVGGRRAAATALAEFQGAEANELTLRAVRDTDPQVQATAVGQLRFRGIPGALTILLEKIDSPHEEVRQAARANLAEFSFDRYLAAFDLLDDEVRVSTGRLVCKIDQVVLPRLTEELAARGRTRRIRALQVVQAIDAVAELEGPVIERLADDDHLVRVEAARALAACDSQQTRSALAALADDRSVAVQEAAAMSLAALDGEPVEYSPVAWDVADTQPWPPEHTR